MVSSYAQITTQLTLAPMGIDPNQPAGSDPLVDEIVKTSTRLGRAGQQIDAANQDLMSACIGLQRERSKLLTDESPAHHLLAEKLDGPATSMVRDSDRLGELGDQAFATQAKLLMAGEAYAKTQKEPKAALEKAKTVSTEITEESDRIIHRQDGRQTEIAGLRAATLGGYRAGGITRLPAEQGLDLTLQ